MSRFPSTFDPYSAAAFGALSLGSSILGASSRNRAIRDQYGFNQRAAEEELAQQEKVHDLHTTRYRRDLARIRGILAVSAAERGVGSTGSADALDRNAAIEGELNEYALDLGHYLAGRRTLSSLELSQRALQSQGESLFSAGLLGVTQGVSTGLQIGQGIGDIVNTK